MILTLTIILIVTLLSLTSCKEKEEVERFSSEDSFSFFKIDDGNAYRVVHTSSSGEQSSVDMSAYTKTDFKGHTFQFVPGSKTDTVNIDSAKEYGQDYSFNPNPVPLEGTNDYAYELKDYQGRSDDERSLTLHSLNTLDGVEKITPSVVAPAKTASTNSNLESTITPSVPTINNEARNEWFYHGGSWQSTPPKEQAYAIYFPDIDTVQVLDKDGKREQTYHVEHTGTGDKLIPFTNTPEERELVGNVRARLVGIISGTLDAGVDTARRAVGLPTGDVGEGTAAAPTPEEQRNWELVGTSTYKYADVQDKPGVKEVQNDKKVTIGFTDKQGLDNFALVAGKYTFTKVSGFYATEAEAERAIAAKARGETPDGSKSTGPSVSDSGHEFVAGKDGSYTVSNANTKLIVERRYKQVVSGGKVSAPGEPGELAWRTDYFYEKNKDDDSPDGQLYKYTLTVNGEIATMAWEGINFGCVGCAGNDALTRYHRQQNWDHYMSAGQAGVAWSQLSSIFGMDEDFADWRADIDKMFHDAFLGSEYWSEAICANKEDVGSGQDVMFSFNEEGLLTQAASIYATKQFIQTPDGNEWLYRISFFLRNPSRPTSTTSFGSRSRGSSGLLARDSGLDDIADLTGAERDTWNIVKKAGREISNERSRYSRTAKDDIEFDFNIQFRGQRTVDLFTEDDVVDSGDEVSYTGDDSFAAYSSYDYNQVCIIFPNEKPIDAFYEDVSEVCTPIVDVSDSFPTNIPVETEDRVERTNNGDFRII